MKIFEIPDRHFIPGELGEQINKTIIDAAEREHPDVIVFAGDLYDAPLMASDKGGVTQLRRFIKNLSKIAQVIAIYGTPSHEPPGSLDLLDLTVLKPGMVYGLYKSGVHPVVTPDGFSTIFFGIPELNKKNIGELPATQSNAEVEKALRQYILEFVAPMRLKYAKVPAFGVFHGNVSSSKRENCTDKVLSSADILVHLEDLQSANLTRWILGHIHKPWEAQDRSAGYAGSWGTSWGETDFVPAFNCWEDGAIKRIPYGTPKRIKITTTLLAYDPAIAYWLDTDDASAPVPTGHPWSRKTSAPALTVTRRTDADTRQATLAELFKIADPDIRESIMSKVAEMELKISRMSNIPINASVDYIEITGCKLFKSRSVSLDVSALPVGISAITGDNGDGKSSLLSFCSPYPVLIGKNTESGRDSAIKDFFPEGGTIKKVLTVNGQKHEHFITIKTKTETYLKIDGIQQLDKGTFSEMFETCEKLYGPYSDYLLTTFYIQPLQSKSGSSLMSAGMTEIRNLVQSIAGIDRETEKRFCLDKVSETTQEIDKIESWIKGAEEFQIDIDASRARAKELADQSLIVEASVTKTKAFLKESTSVRDALISKKQKSDGEKSRRNENTTRIVKIKSDIAGRNARIDGLNKACESLETNRAIIAKHEENQKIVQANETLRNEYRAKVNEWESKKLDYDREISVHANQERSRLAKIENLQIRLTSLLNDNTRIADPCEKCGHVKESAKQKISENMMEIESIEVNRRSLSTTQPAPAVFDLPRPVAPVETPVSVITADISATRHAIDDAVSSELVRKEIVDTIASLRSEQAALENTVYTIDENIDHEVQKANDNMAVLDVELAKWTAQHSRLFAEKDQVEKAINSALETVQKIASERKRLTTVRAELNDWSRMVTLLSANKIPAIELEFFLSAIDRDATTTLESFLDAQYSITTQTQSVGKKDIVDKFDIVVHDNVMGTDQSFATFNPGHKAFFNDAYVKALIKQRNERSQRSYSPIIFDEADAPIQPDRIAMYYDIQRRTYTTEKVLVVTQKDSAKEHIENSINIKELMK